MVRARFRPLILLLSAMALAAPAAASAQSDVGPIDQAVVDRALDYLNRTRSMTARFVQWRSDGGRWTGRLWMERPGRLRFQYDPPENDVIWTNGGLVKHYDADLESLTHLPRRSTPAWFLLDDQVRVKEDVTLLATEDRGDRYYVAAAQSGILTEGRVTLAFRSNPEAIIGWSVTTGDGEVTQVDLLDLVTGQDVPDDVFEYEPPPGTAGR